MLTTSSLLDPHFETLVDVLQWRASHQANRVALTFLLDGETDEARLTYAELDRRARAIGALLQNEGATGGRALLLFPPGLDYIAAFFGCLYGGVVAVPAYPPKRNRSIDRLQGIVDNAEAAFVLSTNQLVASLRRSAPESGGLGLLSWLATDHVGEGVEDAWQKPVIDSRSLAFLQYTSGSTGTPKGVMVSHGNLVENSTQLRDKFGLGSESHGVIWLPPYHDMGLVGGIIQPIFAGFPATLMAPADFLQQPRRWLQAIARVGATVAGGPNFAFDLCARKIGPEERSSLDLSTWQIAFCGSEPVRPDVMERFITAFEPCGLCRSAFYPVYGLAEATLLVSGGKLNVPPVIRSFHRVALASNRAVIVPFGEPDSQALVGCGDASIGQEIAIVHPDTFTGCAPDEIGEIWIKGPNVAQGYWQKPIETKRDFQAYRSDTGAGTYLRTGDLGIALDGELFITGRIKDLIIIRGSNHYPQDIEATVEKSHPALRPSCSAAFSVIDGTEERLVVVCEVDREHRHPDIPAIARAIRQAVSEEHGILVHEIVLIKHASIPKTSSGKIQRHACRDGYFAGDLGVVGRVGPELVRESAMRSSKTWAGDRLDRDHLLSLREGERPVALITYLQHVVAPLAEIPVADVSVTRPLMSLGLDSLAAVELTNRVETDLGVVINLDNIDAEVNLLQFATTILDRLPPVGSAT